MHLEAATAEFGPSGHRRKVEAISAKGKRLAAACFCSFTDGISGVAVLVQCK